MEFFFTKMHGAGNDFIMARTPDLPEADLAAMFPAEKIAFLCDRHKGIGADGLIFVRPLPVSPAASGDDTELEMRYFNSDGSAAAMCGNGLRCAASFAYLNGLSGKARKMRFRSASITADARIMNEAGDVVRIRMKIDESFQKYSVEYEGQFLEVFKGTVGVPHAIVCAENREKLESLDVRALGAFLRYHSVFAPSGVNVDFLAFSGEDRRAGRVMIRTYERGVEDETLACGTGCASSAAVLREFFSFPEKITLFCRGGDEIGIEFSGECNTLKEVLLTGPAKIVFAGKILI